MLLGDDAIQDLDGVVRMTPQCIHRPERELALVLPGGEDHFGHTEIFFPVQG